MQKFSVKEPAPLLEFLFSRCAGMKKTSVKQLLKYGSVRVNGQVITLHSHRLRIGDRIEILGKKAAKTEHFKSHPDFKIIFEDDSLIVVDKPPGLLTMGTEHEKEKTLYFMLTEYQRAQSHTGRGRIFIVHRLDRDASGVLIFAKGETVKRLLQRNWRDVEKRYYAITEGLPRPKHGVIKSHLVEDKFKRVYSTQTSDPEARLSVTHYRVLQEQERYALLDVELETGRKNQIRVHLSEMGHPIAGDAKYGAKTDPLRRLALHAYHLALDHPITGETLIFRSPHPETFQRLVPHA